MTAYKSVDTHVPTLSLFYLEKMSKSISAADATRAVRYLAFDLAAASVGYYYYIAKENKFRLTTFSYTVQYVLSSGWDDVEK
jgi:hypothetical protein